MDDILITDEETEQQNKDFEAMGIKVVVTN